MLLKILKTQLKPYGKFILLLVLLQLASIFLQLLLPALNARIIDDGIAKGDIELIWRLGGGMLLMALVQADAAIVAIYFGAKTAMGVGRDLRSRVYTTVSAFSNQQIKNFGAPTLITRGTNDVQQIQMTVLMFLNFMVMVPLMAIGGIVMAIQQDIGLSWLVWVSVPVLLILVSIMMTRLIPKFTVMQKNLDGINQVLREQLVGIRVVRAFAREAHEEERFAEANHKITDISVSIGRIFILLGPVITLILHVATAAVLYFGAFRVDAGIIEVGSLTAFLQYLLQILTAVMMGTFMMMMLPRALVSADRIGELLNAPTQVAPEAVAALATQKSSADDVAQEAQAKGLDLVCENLSFNYPGADVPVLENLTFTAPAGKTTAIIGGTGSGKTTLLDVLAGLAEPSAGSIRYGALDRAGVNPLGTELVERINVVPQKPYLFSGTIASNLRFADPDADEDRLWDVLRIAQAEEFARNRSTADPDAIEVQVTGAAGHGGGEAFAAELSAAEANQLPQVHGLESTIAQGGTDVSGGQRQRLCIARALVKRKPIYFFDDAFSALDVATEARLRAALTDELDGATVLLVAQRVASIRDADQILVLEAGKIVARGTHDELLDGSPTYREIVESQGGQEALALCETTSNDQTPEGGAQ
ncbi:ABC transporter ATP-binding protein [Micrococcoides hystricis]|uniref:ABC transporter ATP-binding protein n=1 Tax=Micrococcoides hystricis TaxID=1572761 RepID=A0ABV6PBC6_9MICC